MEYYGDKYWKTDVKTVNSVKFKDIIYMKKGKESDYSSFNYVVEYNDTAYVGGNGLPDTQCSEHLYVSKSGFKVVDGKEWKCATPSLCGSKTYSETYTKYKSTDFCPGNIFNCRIVLKVNWTK